MDKMQWEITDEGCKIVDVPQDVFDIVSNCVLKYHQHMTDNDQIQLIMTVCALLTGQIKLYEEEDNAKD